MNIHGVLKFRCTNGAKVTIHARDVFLVHNTNEANIDRYCVVMMANGQGYDVEKDDWLQVNRAWEIWHQFGAQIHAPN